MLQCVRCLGNECCHEKQVRICVCVLQCVYHVNCVCVAVRVFREVSLCAAVCVLQCVLQFVLQCVLQCVLA